MTIQEIRDLIAKKIAGQGTQVDVGGGLPTILNEILDAIESTSSILSMPSPVLFGGVSKSEAAGNLGISEEEFDRLMEGGYSAVKIESGSGLSQSGGLYPICVLEWDYPTIYIILVDGNTDVAVPFFIRRNQDGTYTFGEV